MLARDLDGGLSEFDLKHFCDGSPIYCYYFRLPALQEKQVRLSKTARSSEILSKEIPFSTSLEKEISLKAKELLSREDC